VSTILTTTSLEEFPELTTEDDIEISEILYSFSSQRDRRLKYTESTLWDRKATNIDRSQAKRPNKPVN
jgi:hypothetical protein